MKKTSILFLGLLSSAGFSQTLPEINDINIEQLKYGGSGCPQGTSSVTVTNTDPNNEKADYFEVVFDDYIVKSGPGIPRRQSMKNCNISMVVKYPEGYKFKFQGLAYEGYAEIPEKIRAQFDTTFRVFPSQKKSLTHTLLPVYSGSFSRKDTEKVIQESFYSDCSGSTLFNIDTIISIKGDRRNVHGIVSYDSTDGLLKSVYRLYWEKC